MVPFMLARRHAFTLVELLVSIGIVVLLISMIFTAIQKVREAAHKVVCADNLRQIGIAAHQYHCDHARLPPGYLGPSLKNNTNFPAHLLDGQWIGHLPLLLPYLEEDTVFRRIKTDFNIQVATSEPWFWLRGQVSNDTNYAAAFTKLKIFRCPSASNFAPEPGTVVGTGGTLLGEHVFNDPMHGPFTSGWKDDYVKAARYRFLGRTNYMGVAGCGSGTHPFFSKFEGVYTNRSQNTLGQIAAQDGTSNTLLYGETCGSHWSGSPPETYDICWMGGGALGTYLGLQQRSFALTIAFSSYHPAGVQFCFADGSVRILRFGDTVWDQVSPFPKDWLLLQQLAGKNDGGPADASALVD
jgi:prepilin-type processing-associated H-X9-DG protein